MITQTKRNAIRQRIHDRIRRKLAGTAERPRLNVYRSLNNIYAQVIDDASGITLVSASTIKSKTGGNVAAATSITGASKRWPMRPAKPAWNSKRSDQLSGISFFRTDLD